MATALVNIAFGFGHAYLWFCVCWGLNGALQVQSTPFGFFVMIHLQAQTHTYACSIMPSGVCLTLVLIGFYTSSLV